MNQSEFFKSYQPVYRAIYRTTEEMTVETNVWHLFNTPYTDPKEFTIPAGTELVVCSYSAFENGYSMKPLKPRSVFTGKGLTYRWFNCPYAKMEFVREEKVE